MSEYKASKTVVKGTTTAGTVTISGIIGMMAAYKLQPILARNGVDMDVTVLALAITGVVQSAYVMVSNFIKHKVIKK